MKRENKNEVYCQQSWQIPTYGGVLSAIEKALWELVEEYWGVGKSLWDLVEGQERNTAQLERIGAVMERRWDPEEESRKENRNEEEGSENGPEKVRREGLHHLPPVSILVLFFLLIEFFYLFPVN